MVCKWKVAGHLTPTGSVLIKSDQNWDKTQEIMINHSISKICSDLDLWNTNLVQGHSTYFIHNHFLCELWVSKGLRKRSFCPEKHFSLQCLDLWPYWNVQGHCTPVLHRHCLGEVWTILGQEKRTIGLDKVLHSLNLWLKNLVQGHCLIFKFIYCFEITVDF